MARDVPHYPRPAQIEAYGSGQFSFAGMSHRGSLLCLPSGIWAWPVTSASAIDEAALAAVFAEANDIDLLVIGSGDLPWAMPEALRWRVRDHRMTVEIMPTGAAVRTYNILLGEGRRVAAALIAIG